MSERALRGSRLGATSYETDYGVDIAPRREIEYTCPKGHHFTVPFAAEAEIPETRDCRTCGQPALRVDGHAPKENAARPTRTHRYMLMVRRTRHPLKEILHDRLPIPRYSHNVRTRP